METGKYTKGEFTLEETVTFRVDSQTKESINQLMSDLHVTASEFFRRKAVRIISTINEISEK